MQKKNRFWFYSFSVAACLLILINSCKKDSNIPTQQGISVTDFDGNVYQTATIGTQIWMVKNLKVNHYRNGDLIPYVTDSSAWRNLTTGACCDYENTQANDSTYGKLYNWFAVNDSRNIAPVGWHVANNDDWQTLISYLEIGEIVGPSYKLRSSTGWRINGNNSSGFTALPGGCRTIGGLFDSFSSQCIFREVGVSGYWWSATGNQATWAYGWGIYYDTNNVIDFCYNQGRGLSVRCLKD